MTAPNTVVVSSGLDIAGDLYGVAENADGTFSIIVESGRARLSRSAVERLARDLSAHLGVTP